ncbi:MAG: hypothetical protein H0Z18_06410 [Thermococcus sp.]|uniref:hypothetical protein n=1 Tax=Thermococcus sp. TaxID=35749 RepID=UPI001D8C4CC8|nr:hypothetical protein [Thermococcus sp.]MBO8174875.1 hypothetical protein [Thermococcus sp.]
MFLLDLIALAFYAVSGDIPKRIDFYGMMLENIHDTPKWLKEDVKVLEEILKEKSKILTLTPVFYSVLGSYDPTVPMFAFKERDTLYLVSIPYKQVVKLETKRFARYVAEVVEMALRELNGYIPLFEEYGINEYAKRINTLKDVWELLKRKTGRYESTISGK